MPSSCEKAIGTPCQAPRAPAGSGPPELPPLAVVGQGSAILDLLVPSRCLQDGAKKQACKGETEAGLAKDIRGQATAAQNG